MMDIKDEDLTRIAQYSKETGNPKSVFRSRMYIGATAMEALVVLAQFVVNRNHHT